MGENPGNNGIFLQGHNGVFEPEMQGNRGGKMEEEPSEIQGVSRVIQPLYHAPTQDLQAVESTGENSVHLSRVNEPRVEASSGPP